MSLLGLLGRAKNPLPAKFRTERGSAERRFCGFGYARIAAKSSGQPMMFMTRVRLQARTLSAISVATFGQAPIGNFGDYRIICLFNRTRI